MSLYNKNLLSAELASAIAAGCVEKARREGWKMVIAVADHGGALKHFTRMDGALPISIGLSQLTANSSANLPMSTRRTREVSGKVIGLELVPGVTTVAGGLPIMTADGQWLGAVGVSGDSEDNDEHCAQAGIDAVQHLLK